MWRDLEKSLNQLKTRLSWNTVSFKGLFPHQLFSLQSSRSLFKLCRAPSSKTTHHFRSRHWGFTKWDFLTPKKKAVLEVKLHSNWLTFVFFGCLGSLKPTISACFDAALNQVEPAQLDFRTKRQLSRLKATCRIFFRVFQIVALNGNRSLR